MRRSWRGRAGIAAGATVGLLAAIVGPARAGQAQTIEFDQFPDLQVNESDYLKATATSGLDVVFASTTPEICVVDGTALTARQVGNCVITASQPGNATWDPAPVVTRSATMEQGEVNQGIAKPPLTNQLKDPVVFDFVVQPTRMWTGQVLPTGTYNITIANEMGQRIVETDSPLDPVEGSGKYVFNDPLITPPLGPDWYVAFGCFNGDANYNGNSADCGALGQPFQMHRYATTTSVTVTPNPARFGQSVTATSTTRGPDGKPVESSGATVLWEWRGPDGHYGVETAADDGTSSVVIDNLGFGQGTPVFGQYLDKTSEYGTSWHNVPVEVKQGVQEVVFGALYDIEVGGTQGLIVDSNSDNPIDVATTTPAVCTIKDDMVRALKLGTCSVTATQDGTEEWEAAKPVTRSFDVMDDAAHLSYADGTTVVGQALTPLTPQINGLKGTLTFSANGLMDGLDINKRTGVIAGTPKAATDGPALVTAIAKGSGDREAGATFRIDVKPLPYPAKVLYADGKGQVDKQFAPLTPQVSGFSGKVRFRTDQPLGPSPAPADGMPLGLGVDADTGRIAGTPRQTGTFTPTIVATDGVKSVTTTVTIVITKKAAKPSLSYPKKSKATVGVPMTPVYPQAVALGKKVQFSASGLPKGVRITTTKGVVKGTPTKAGTYSVKATARGGKGKAKATFTLRVHKSPLQPAVSYPDVRTVVGTKLPSVKPVVVGMPGTLRFLAKRVPAGLSVNKTTGILAGTPKKVGATSVRVTVSNGSVQTKTRFVAQILRK